MQVSCFQANSHIQSYQSLPHCKERFVGVCFSSRPMDCNFCQGADWELERHSSKTKLEPEMSKYVAGRRIAVDYIGSSSQNCTLAILDFPSKTSLHTGERRKIKAVIPLGTKSKTANRASAWVISAPSSSKTFFPASGTKQILQWAPPNMCYLSKTCLQSLESFCQLSV